MKSCQEFKRDEQEQRILDYIIWYGKEMRRNNRIENINLTRDDIRIAQQMPLEKHDREALKQIIELQIQSKMRRARYLIELTRKKSPESQANSRPYTR